MMIGHSPRSVPTEAPRTELCRAVVWGLAVVGLMTAAPAGASPEARTGIIRTYYERSLILQADANCRLFTPQTAAALKASTFQARGAAERAGADAAELAATAANARAAADSTSCGDADLATVKARVTDAYSAWAELRRMAFPGERAAWKADRTRFEAPDWRLVQVTKTGGAVVNFGMVSTEGQMDEVAAVVTFPGKSRPIAARVVMRDAERLARPWVLSGGANETPGLPPEAGRRAVYAAGSREAAPSLLGEDRKQGQVWTFGPEVIDSLAALDTREPFVVEFLFRDDSIARARFEVGDLAAGRAFAAMGAF